MAEQVFVRETGPGQWQWQACDSQGCWLEDLKDSGDGEAFIAALPSPSTPVNILMRGQQVIATTVNIDAKQRKHAGQLIPFELEDELSSSVEDLHFSFSANDDDVFVLYVDNKACEESISVLDEHNCDVRSAVPDYLLLKRPESGITLLLDNDVLSVRISQHWGFAVERELANVLLSRLALHSAFETLPPDNLLLVAADEDELAQLKSWLPEAWKALDIVDEIGDFWSCADPDALALDLNLRRGRFARQLPIKRWWALWQWPSYMLGTAFVLAVLVNFVAYLGEKSTEKHILENMNTVYLDAVPDGRLGDVERMLESKISTIKKTNNEPTNFVFLLSKVSKIVGSDDNSTLTDFSYSGDQRSLQLTMEFSSLPALTEFRNQLQQVGVESDSPRTSSSGEGYQARLKVRGAQR